jgi:diaminopimelate decarboxylase
MRQTALEVSQAASAYGCGIYGVIKALPSPEFLSCIKDQVVGFDVSNLGELNEVCEWARTEEALPLTDISMTGPAMQLGHIGEGLICERLIVNFEHQSQLALLSKLHPLAREIVVGVRVRMAGAFDSASPFRESRFGVPVGDLSGILRIAEHSQFSSIHFHGDGDRGSGPDHAATANLIANLMEHLPRRPRFVCLGGGFRSQSISELAATFSSVRSALPTDVQVRFEPGTYLAEAAGFAISEVLQIREDIERDITTIVIDLSREGHARWSHLSLSSWWGPALKTTLIRVVGPTCSETDDFGTFQVQPGRTFEIEKGARPLVALSGLSGYAHAFNTRFNGLPAAKVVMLGGR